MPKTLRDSGQVGKERQSLLHCYLLIKKSRRDWKSTSYLKCVPNSGGQIPRDFLTRGSLGHGSREAGHGAMVYRCLEEQGLLPRRGISSLHGILFPQLSAFPHGLWGRDWASVCWWEGWARSSQSTRENMQCFVFALPYLLLVSPFPLPLDFSTSQASFYTHRHIYVYMYVYICICSTYERIRNWGSGESCLFHLTWFSLILPIFLNVIPFYLLL